MAEISHHCDDINRSGDSNEEDQSSSKRRIIVNSSDRLSELPDSLILQILCLLDSTKEVVRTSVLSKRWQNVWTSIHSLVFEHDDEVTIPHFAMFVYKTLTQCPRNLKLNHFKIHLKYDQYFDSHMDLWIHYALLRKVEDLNVDLWTRCGEEFVLSEHIFVNPVLTKLRFSFCYLEPEGMIYWKMLKSLHLKRIQLSEYLIENILSGSPLLEILKLDSCYGFSSLDITSTSVKSLVLDGFDPHDAQVGLDDVVEVNAPNVLALEITGTFLLWKLLLLDVSSVIEANLNYTKLGRSQTTRKRTQEEMLEGFIQRLRHVKELTVGFLCSQVLSRLVAKGFSFSSNMKFPILEPCDSGSDSEDEYWEETVLGQGPDEVDDGPDSDEVDEEPDDNRVDDIPDGDEVDNVATA